MKKKKVVVRDQYGTKLKYPNRHCKDCKRYPCFSGIENCKSDFGSYGCTIWIGEEKSNVNDSSM